MRFGWLGCHQEGLAPLRGLLEAGVDIAGVITQRPELAARRSGAGDYAGLCAEFGLPLHEIDNVNDDRAVELLRSLSLDVLLVIGWHQILRREALRTARVGVVGAHASLLPHNRGSAPINWTLIRGETQAGNSLIWLSEEVDAGNIIDQTAFCVTPYDTCATLYDRVADSNRRMLLALVERLLDGETVVGRPHHGDEPVLPRRRPQDGLVDWSRDAKAVYDFVRALTRPYPGAFSSLEGRRWSIWSSALLPGTVCGGSVPGEVLGPVVSPVDAACGQLVACGRGAVLLLEVASDDGELLSGRRLSDRGWTGRVWTDG